MAERRHSNIVLVTRVEDIANFIEVLYNVDKVKPFSRKLIIPKYCKIDV